MGDRDSKLRTFRDPERQRLSDAIEVARARLRAHNGDAKHGKEMLDRAAEAAAMGAIDRGWALVHAAHELEVALYDGPAITAEAIAVDLEVSSPRFSGWRRRAILEQLEPVLRLDPDGSPALSLAVRRSWLVQALRNRDELHAREYRNTAIVRRYHAVLLAVAMTILGGAVVGAALANPSFEGGADAWWVAIGAALAGALGGVTSALQRTTRRTIERIPERLGSLVSSLSRPAMGAIAGSTVFLAVRAGVTQTDSRQQVAYLLLLAFGAGFSERLVVRDPREEASDRAARQEGAPPAGGGTSGAAHVAPAATNQPQLVAAAKGADGNGQASEPEGGEH